MPRWIGGDQGQQGQEKRLPDLRFFVPKTTRDEEKAAPHQAGSVRAPKRVVCERMRCTGWWFDGCASCSRRGNRSPAPRLVPHAALSLSLRRTDKVQPIEETMVAKSKPKSKRRPATKPRRSKNKPLLARSAEVRKAKPEPRWRVAVVSPVPLAANPFAMFGMMERVMQAYAKLPGRLAQCRSPMDVGWSRCDLHSACLAEIRHRPSSTDRAIGS